MGLWEGMVWVGKKVIIIFRCRNFNVCVGLCCVGIFYDVVFWGGGFGGCVFDDCWFRYFVDVYFDLIFDVILWI